MELQFASAEISSEQSPTGYGAQSHQGLEMHHRFLQFCSFACGSAALRFFTRRRPPRVINQTVPLPREGEDNASPTRHGRMHGSLPPQKRGRGCVSRVLPISPLRGGVRVNTPTKAAAVATAVASFSLRCAFLLRRSLRRRHRLCRLPTDLLLDRPDMGLLGPYSPN